MLLANGTSAPPFSLNAAVTKRPFSLQEPAETIMLLFHSYQTAPLAAEAIRTVRQEHPQHTKILIATVADMRIVPRLLRGTAETIMRQVYKEAARQVPKGQDPANHIIILPDWEGRLFQAYQVPDTKQQIGLVIINQERVIQSSYFGKQPAWAALKLIKNHVNSKQN